jgi:hypothetical protein
MAHKRISRRRGEGSMYKEVRPGGSTRYVAQICVNGKRLRRFAATPQEALAKLRELRAEHKSGEDRAYTADKKEVS